MVTRKNQQREEMETTNKQKYQTITAHTAAINASNSINQDPNESGKVKSQDRFMTLKDVLTDARALEMFMQHLILLGFLFITRNSFYSLI